MLKRGIFTLLAIVFLSAAAFSLTDEDGDTYCPFDDTGCPPGLDCNDNNPMINPAADEVPSDGIDNDCNGIVDDACTDADNDGYNKEADAAGVDCGGEANVDCDDADIYVNPGAEEICDDGIDNDCSGLIDDEDPACAAAGGELAESGCTLTPEMSLWIDCGGEGINSANEGDTVYMLLFAEGCDEDADVVFGIYEHSPGAGSLEDTVTGVEILTDIPDEDGNPTEDDVWLAPWIATYIEDDDGTGPEFYFTATLTEPGGAVRELTSGRTDDELLAVTGCSNCGVECTLDLGGLLGGGGGVTLQTPPCEAEVDCTSAPWSSCDPSTGKMTRDIELCEVSGTGTVECMENAKMRMAAEKLCSTSAAPVRKSTPGPEPGECGDGICDEGEEESCPEDCAVDEGFPWLWLLLAVVAAGAIASGVIYSYQKKKKAGVKKPGEKMPFAQQNDLDSVLGYISTARAKGYNDAQVAEALKKAGWKDEQIKYAFGKTKGETAKEVQKPAQTVKPAEQKAK